jgi:hypothetical protein
MWKNRYYLSGDPLLFWWLLILLLQGGQCFSCVPFRGRGPRSGEGVLEGKNRKETQSRAGRLSAVRIAAECHIGAWPRTPYGPSRGSEGGWREIFESYSSCTLPAGPLWWLAPPPCSPGGAGGTMGAGLLSQFMFMAITAANHTTALTGEARL